MRQKVFINICEESLGLKTSISYKKAYADLYSKHNIITYVYYIGTSQSNQQFEYQQTFLCKDEKEMKEQISQVYKKFEVLFINTFTEGLIELCNTIKEELGEPITTHSKAFRDKSIQRDALQRYNPELGIKYLQYTFEEIDTQYIEDFLGYPCVVKPSSGIQSAGVAILQNRKDLDIYMNEYNAFLEKFTARGFTNATLLFEEFIDGEMYSVDYFVDKDGKILSSPPVHVGIGENIGIDDFMNYVRSYRKKTIGDINTDYLKKFIEGSVIALEIKNTFIHHEFKLTGDQKLKTIEINGRIGGYRLEMIQEALEYNWLCCIQEKTDLELTLQNNFSSFLIYPEKKGELLGFNEDTFKQIEKLPSLYFINKIQSFIGKEIGLTKQGFTKVAIIKIKNYDQLIFERDYAFIEENFKNLLLVKI